jgi:polysaccharide pyruvyl transferase WcaK-like protein
LYRIFIAENIPSLNKGEMTIIKGMMETFKSLGEIEISMVSSIPDIDQNRYGEYIKIVDFRKSLLLFGNIQNYPKMTRVLASISVTFQHWIFMLLYMILGAKVLKLMKSDIWKSYYEADVIFIGHNGTFGIGGPLGIYKGFSFSYLPFIGKVLRKPTVIYGGSIFRYRKSQKYLWRLIKFVLKRVDLITLREKTSLKYLAEMGINNKRAFVTGDPAFLLQPAPQEQILRIMNCEGVIASERPLIGITITREVACNAFPGLDNVSSYNLHLKLIAEVVDNIISNFSATVIFIPHSVGSGPGFDNTDFDDRIAAKDVLKMCRNQSDVVIITNEYSASELKGLIGICKLFIGERIHSTINALSMGVPSIVLVRKNDQRQDIIRMLGQESAICYVEHLDSKSLINKVTETWSKAELIRDQLKIQVPAMKEQSMYNGILLKQLLTSYPKK